LGRAGKALLWMVLCSGMVYVIPTAADTDVAGGHLTVLYPEIGEPYRSAFSTIVQGIEERNKGRTVRLAIPTDNAGANGVIEDLRQHPARAVIALGRSGLKAAASLDRQVPVIVGGVLSVPEADAQSFLIQSLAPDPALLFARLKAFVPQARRVVVVYDPRQNDWLIRLARDAARNLGLELLALEADDLKSALRHYQGLIGSITPKRDVLWLPQDSSTVDDSTVLPWLLRESWDQGLVVFSSNVAHVRRGALFSLYPDNLELGRHLGNTAQALINVNAGAPVPATPRGLQALRQVRTAVNTRTAEHLGLDLRASGQRIHLVLPEQ
jgi:putative tryptophan/tyrosine transport system substrate-binding protein